MTVAVLLSGGSGTRMHIDIPKQHIMVGDHQIIDYTLELFSNCRAIDAIMVVSNVNYLERVKQMRRMYPKLRWVVEGGVTRNWSVFSAVQTLSEFCKPEDKILITDAVRIFVTEEEILSLLDSLKTFSAATTGITCNETILQMEDNAILSVIPRKGIVRQTSPEAYQYSVLERLYLKSDRETVGSYTNIGIDQLWKEGVKIAVIESNPLNFKITTYKDLLLCKALLQVLNKERNDQQEPEVGGNKMDCPPPN